MQLMMTVSLNRRDLVKMSERTEAYYYDSARIEVLDWDTKEMTTQVEYQTLPDNIAPGMSSRLTGGCLWRDKWLQTSHTELIIFNPTDWSVENVISHPSFNDLHGVSVAGDEIAVVNTGLQMIQFLDPSGVIQREVNLASVPTWEQYDRSCDYRKVESTKPHEIHPNHVFRLNGQWWATRFHQRDAINLEDHTDRIDIGVGNPHDGIVRGDHVYFTTTNARIVIANIATRQVEEIIDLNELNPQDVRIGWARGLEIDGNHAYVSFTRLRYTKWKEALRSIKDAFTMPLRNSHIEKIDLVRKEVVDEFDYGTERGAAIFTLIDYERVMKSTRASTSSNRAEVSPCLA